VKETEDKPRDRLQDAWPTFPQMVKVMENEEGQRKTVAYQRG
jgi:hypothetical protein